MIPKTWKNSCDAHMPLYAASNATYDAASESECN